MEKCSAVIMMAGSRHVHPYNTLEDHEISPQVMDNGDTSLGNGDKKKKKGTMTRGWHTQQMMLERWEGAICLQRSERKGNISNYRHM